MREVEIEAQGSHAQPSSDPVYPVLGAKPAMGFCRAAISTFFL